MRKSEQLPTGVIGSHRYDVEARRRKRISLGIAELEARTEPKVMKFRNGVVTVHFAKTGRTADYDFEALELAVSAPDSILGSPADGGPMTKEQELLLAERFMVLELARCYRNDEYASDR